MAIRNLTEKQSKSNVLNKNIQLGKDRYTWRVLDESFELAKSSGNPMVIRKFEMITESVVAPDGSTIVTAGTEVTRYYSLKSEGTADKSAEEVTNGLLDQFKIDTEIIAPGKVDWSLFDDEKPPLVCKGVIFEAIGCGIKKEERKPAVPGKKLGEVIRGLDGKPLVRYETVITQFLGPSTTKIAQPY